MGFMSLVLDSTRSKIAALKQRKVKYVTSTSAIGDHALSIEYTKIPLSRPCKRVELYYMGENIAAYRNLIMYVNQCLSNASLNMSSPADSLEMYVNGWQNGKIITPQDIERLRKSISSRITLLRAAHNRFDMLLGKFNELNNSHEGDMVDHVSFNLHETTTEFPYRRAYNHFFRKHKVEDKVIETHLKNDDDILDMLMSLITALYAGWDKTGKGDAFEKFRSDQHALIILAQLYADALELDIQLYEKFATVNEMVVAFKLYPSNH